MTQHTYYKCDGERTACQEGRCNICSGGLAVCTVCGGAEGELTLECPGIKLDEHVRYAILQGSLDFCGGEWHVQILTKRKRELPPHKVFLEHITALIKNLLINNPNYNNSHYWVNPGGGRNFSKLLKETIERAGYLLEEIEKTKHLIEEP